MNGEKALHTLIPLGDFKNILGIDDREDALSSFCLVTATYTIEQYCRRRLFRKVIKETLPFTGDYIFTLREYPVRKISSVHVASLIDPKHYCCFPDEGISEDLPFSLMLRPPFKLSREQTIKVRYWAGYSMGKAPSDLACACMELAAWNMTRYRGRRIGMGGAVRGRGAGEQLESSMPENVRLLVEPYRRVTI
jgi:hypothetical protein